MRETEEKAKGGMIWFVIAIFTIAVMLALGYFIFLTPGETTSTTINTQQ